jgi:hypothetical protein
MKIAANALAAGQIETIRANAMRSGRIVSGLRLIHAKDPCQLAGCTLAQSINGTCALRDREVRTSGLIHAETVT